MKIHFTVLVKKFTVVSTRKEIKNKQGKRYVLWVCKYTCIVVK